MKTPLRLSLAALASLTAASALAAPIISEVMSSNGATLADEDGAFSDWIELHNPDATPADLAGWSLTDDATNLRKWVFPAGATIQPGQFLVVWASGKNRTADPANLHTNFSLAAAGEYLALTAPDGVTKSSEFAPTLPPLEADQSYGPQFAQATYLTAGTAAATKIPADDSLGTSWRDRTFVPDGSWLSGPLNVGFGMQVPGWAVQERRSGVTLTSLALTEACLNGTNALDNLTATHPVLNYVGSGGGNGHFADELNFLHGPAENFALRGTGTITVPTAGAWTFCLNSDDGGRIRIDLNRDGDFLDAGETVVNVDAARGAADTFGTTTLQAGTYAIEVIYFEQGGGEALEVSAAPGSLTSFTNAFKLVGDTANGGLGILSTPGTAGGTGAGTVATNVSGPMLNVRSSAYVRVPFTVANPSQIESLSLAMAHNDGFVAWINGVEVARRNAPGTLAFNSAATATRATADSLVPEVINVTSAAASLVAGTNVLAVQGLNASAADASFYVAPSLSAFSMAGQSPLFFRTATPGAANTGSGFLGSVADTVFTPKRGHYTSPQTVTLTTATPGAVIRYTLNGATPTATTGTVYTAPITLTSSTVIRAAAFLAGWEPTNVDTHTYLFLDDVITQSSTAPAGWPNVLTSTSWPSPQYRVTASNLQIFNYGMDPAIVNNTNTAIGGAAQVKTALMSLPTICLTTDMANLTDANTGIYTHANSHGKSWERPASIEMFNDVYDTTTVAPANAKGFSENCGLRIRGGYSRSDDNPKHAWRVFFRSEYGKGKLKYPIFQDEGASEFDTFDIQCSQNYSWSFGGDATNTFLRELWSRDTQLAMGWPSTHGRFYHLYVNGLYWGLYQIEERAESDFAASYLGGNAENFDVIKHTGNSAGYTVEATDGNFITTPEGGVAPWKQLWDLSRRCWAVNTNKNPANLSATLNSTLEEKNAAYFKLFGLAADGKTPTGDPVLLDLDNMIDYMLIIFFSGNTDAPLSNFLSNASPNNYYCVRDRTKNRGFFSIQHDAEHTLNAGSAASDRIGATADAVYKYYYYNSPTADWNSINKSNPQFFHQDLMPNAEYRLRFADRIYKHMFNNGVLATANNKARMASRAAWVEKGIIAESARWGNSKVSSPLTAANWRSAKDATLSWFDSRNAAFLSLAKQKYLYPPIDPPVFNLRGGNVPAGFQLTLTNPNAGGTIYYTLDGTDPRPAGTGTTVTTLVPEFSTAQYLVPSEANGGSGLAIMQWAGNAPPLNAASWLTGQMGFGFVPAGRPSTTDFTPFIKTDVQALMQDTANGFSNATLWVRVPVTLTADQAANAVGLRVRARYDDGFIVYVNGVEAGRKNIAAGLIPAWNSAAGASHSDSLAITLEDLSVGSTGLVAGQNVIAFHVMNSVSNNADLLFSPIIEIETLSNVPSPVYTGPITLNQPATVKTRVARGSDWSALNEAAFIVNASPANASNLVISEVNYDPNGPQNAGESAWSESDFEFIELQNISSGAVDLTGVQLAGGVTMAFTGTPQQLTLPPGGRTLLVENEAAFKARYGTSVGPIAGVYGGKLSNSGDQIKLVAANGSTIKDFTYGTRAPWPTAADGDGYSLVLINPTANPDHTNPANWRSSVAKNGNPGAAKGSTYAAWQAATGVTDPSSDTDGDSVSAFLEYALGGLPTTPSSALLPRAGTMTLPADASGAVYATVSFVRSLGADDVDYQVQDSTALTAWQSGNAVLVSETNNGDGTATMVYRTAAPVAAAEKAFLRLRTVLRP